MVRTDIPKRKEEILQWIKEERPKAFMCRELGCKPETLESHLKKLGISYKGNQGARNFKNGPIHPQYVSAEEYSKKDYGVKSFVLKNKLFLDGIKEKKCERCHLEKWMGLEIPLELHHKDGNHYNNNLDNLEILCPNCHAQEPNNSGSNIGNYK